MIKTLYEKFQPWSANGSVYLISDTHFEDDDCLLMDIHWIEPQEHIDRIKKIVHKNDTLIHLGDVGNPVWLKQIKAYKVLIMGNHDETATQFKPYFDEIYHFCMCFIFQMFNIQCDWNDFQLLSSLFLSLSLSSLCSPHDRPISGRSGVEARKKTLFRKLAERENGRLMSQNKHLFRVWMPVSFIEHRRGGGEEVKLKRY